MMNMTVYIYNVKSRCRSLAASAARFAYSAALAAALACTASSCSSEGYDTGDGAYSYLAADFALLHTNADRTVTEATLDDGTQLQLSNPFTADWAARADTVYRALLYYDKPVAPATAAKVRSVSQVPVMAVADAAKVTDMRTDPLGVESVWLSKNGSFLNLSLLLKAGTASGDSRQSIGIVCEERFVDTDGRRRVCLRVYHDQNGVPEYYTVQQFVSIAVETFDADVAELHVNTYGGEVVREVEL